MNERIKQQKTKVSAQEDPLASKRKILDTKSEGIQLFGTLPEGTQDKILKEIDQQKKAGKSPKELADYLEILIAEEHKKELANKESESREVIKFNKMDEKGSDKKYVPKLTPEEEKLKIDWRKKGMDTYVDQMESSLENIKDKEKPKSEKKPN